MINATKDLVCAYKPNMAFYEMYGVYGLSSLIKTIEYIADTDLPVILDAKRGDVGHSSAAYAKSAFEVFKADAVTVNPYLGHDSIEPFIAYQEKGIFILCLTSNKGFKDFQVACLPRRVVGPAGTAGTDEPLYKLVARHVKEWNHYKNCGLVVGATKPEELKGIRELVPDIPFLIPGVGAQGGDIEASIKYGIDKKGRVVINASRSILYASNKFDFAEAARITAKEMKESINRCKPPRVN
jgi:orotidine-5'-phosphate decarboxylase